MASDQLRTLLGFLKVLADESRMKILGLLAQREHSVKELADFLDLKEPTVSHHLAKMDEYEIVSMRGVGTTHLYRLNRGVLKRFRKELFSEHQVTSLANEAVEDAFDRKVLDSFVEGERLTQIPAARKKRDVILRWLVEKFEYDVEYPHKEVNAILKQYHPDTATLRRELIGSKYMTRERDTYWRLPA